jgi:hypothetical protein
MPRLLCIPAVLLLMGRFGSRAAERSWRIELSERDGTELAIQMTLRVDGDRWELYSRPGGVNAFMTWRQRALGRLFRSLPPRGSLIYGSGRVTADGDSTLLRGNLESQLLGRRFLRASVRNDRFQGDLTSQVDTDAVGAHLDGIPRTTSTPLRDYAAIAAQTRDTIRALIYDASIATQPNVREFFERFATAAERATDDLDLVVAFRSEQTRIGISHFAFVRNPRIAGTPLDSIVAGDKSANTARLVNFSLWGDGAVAYLRVSNWDRATPYIQRAFERMDSARTSVLVLDLTSNGGGDATSMIPATHLFRDTMHAGVFLGRPWYAAHRAPPVGTELASLPIVDDEAQAKSLLKILARDGAARVRIAARRPYFAGTVYLLADERTASASEPLTYLLKATGRATVVGARTAGAMLTALPHAVGEGFIVTVPEADYYAEDGFRIEGNGVDPQVFSRDPNVEVDQTIRTTMPYPALEMLGQVAFNRRQFDAAERYWTNALALASTEAGKRALNQRIAEARKAQPPH